MNSSSRRKTYGTLSLTPETARGVQLEWAAIEKPTRPMRFLNFPCVDLDSASAAPRRVRTEKRPLAA